MELKEAVANLKHLLMSMHRDLEKAAKGNKAAAQRVRTDSIKFAKVAKIYRKESLDEQKKAFNKTLVIKKKKR